MLHNKQSFVPKTLVISLIAMSLVGCAGTESTNSQNDSAISPPTDLASSSSPQTTGSAASVAIPGVNNVGEIKFKAASKNSPVGYFDVINGSSASKIEVSKATPLTAAGWAVLVDEARLPDSIIITHGDNNSLVAVAPVNVERPDVVKLLKNPAYKNSGWSATFKSSTLPDDPVVLKAWAYNAARKEATPLEHTHEVVVVE